MKKIIIHSVVYLATVLFVAFSNCIAQTKVVIPGTFQTALGCPSNWMPNCDNTALVYNPSTGMWTGSFNIPAGCHQYKVAIDGSWDVNYGENGIPGGANINLYVPSPTSITFTYNPSTHVVETSPIASGFSTSCLPQVVVVGSFQQALGCNNWDANCSKTTLTYSSTTGLFENDFTLPCGDYEYRIVLDGDWFGNNFGAGGVPNGSNYIYSNDSPSRVHFTYNPITHVLTTTHANIQVNTVVIAGSFQSEVGCPGDWQPDCDNTRMHYNPDAGAWVDTLNIPPGHWEFKFAINNSWDINYGQSGIFNGDNISLDLCYPTKVAFSFYYNSCGNSIGGGQILTNGVCIVKFYDANINSYLDAGEEPMGGVAFTLSGNGITQTQITGSDGKATFTNIPNGYYLVKEHMPIGYYSTAVDSQYAYIFQGNQTLYFGNVCLGPGGAKGIGFWTSKNGEAALNNSGKMQGALSGLRYLSLRNADGTDFDPYTYAQLKTWLMGANAKNMSYMLSAQLAAMFLNTEFGYVDSYKVIYLPDCALLGNFTNVYNLIYITNYYLSYYTTVDGKNPSRAYLECLKNSFDNANSNLTFVQPHPCNGAITNTVTKRIEEADVTLTSAEARIWPNPSNNYFTLRPADNGKKEMVVVKLFNVNGQQVYETKGFSNSDYRFGENLIPGIYMVELIQGNKRETFKVVKH